MIIFSYKFTHEARHKNMQKYVEMHMTWPELSNSHKKSNRSFSTHFYR